MNWFKESPKEQVALIFALATMAVTYLVFGPSCTLFLLPFAVGVVGYTYLRTWSDRRDQSRISSEIVARRESAPSGWEPAADPQPRGNLSESAISATGSFCSPWALSY